MTDMSMIPDAPQPTGRGKSIYTVDARTKQRNAAEARFKLYGIGAITVSLTMLAVMLFTIFADGLSAFRQASVTFPVTPIATMKGTERRPVVTMVSFPEYPSPSTRPSITGACGLICRSMRFRRMTSQKV